MTALSDELANDPLGRGYSAMSDAQAAASLNAKDRPAPVPAEDVTRYLVIAGRWGPLKASTEPVAIELVDSVMHFFDDFDLQDTQVLNSVTAKFDALIALPTPLLDAADKTALLALENNRQSRAGELGMGTVHEGTVTMARAA